MPREQFKRPAHRQVVAALSALNAAFLREARCYFGGGTRIVLELGEYRDSKDIDFLCSDRAGYRKLREHVSENSLGPVVGKKLRLAREVRADQYGVRTFLDTKEGPLKFEVVLEARIELGGAAAPGLPVDCLDHKRCFAEKFLANADRGLDAATLSRDIVDLAFMIRCWGSAEAQAGLKLAESPYGASVRRSIRAVRQKMRSDRAYRNRCIEGLAVEDTRTLSAGLKALADFE